MIFSAFFRKEFREWHAVEHQCALLIQAAMPITENNLRRISPVLYRCGAGVLVSDLQIHIILWIQILAALGFIGLSTSHIFFLLLLLACTLLARELPNHYIRKRRGNNNVIKFFLVVLSFPGFVLPFLCERVFVLKYPSEDKIAIAVRELKIFMNEINSATRRPLFSCFN